MKVWKQIIKFVSKGEESMTSNFKVGEGGDRGPRENNERKTKLGGGDNVEKNQAKRTHARCGDKQKVRESGETEVGERGPRKSNEREREWEGGGEKG